MSTTLPPAIFLMGPTASGKTGAAVELAQKWPVEIISVDSALVFKHMNIGTAKPDAATLERAPHLLIDLIDPTERYSTAQFREDALRVMAEIVARGKVPLLVGGTMLYYNTLQHGIHDLPQADPALRAELDAEAARLGWPHLHARLAALDPQTAARLEPTDSQRVQRALEVCLLAGRPMSELLQEDTTPGLPYRLLKLALLPSDRAVLHQRIADRFKQMLQDGLIDEVEALRRQFQLDPNLPSMRCVGYRQTWDYLDGLLDSSGLLERGIVATRQLAKRQLTWLRGMDDTIEVDCLSPALLPQIEQELARFLAVS
ncbi:tRNA (adenosine(37)-N6)-dimethylallyltransferase MiaA [Parachitinimonas caeni]|uniref:tRNA dimethylallyltransferase n=1 Tax=Parachitinimonas caeni TaxID=3031301 RepID=A0ABT7DTZ5_9NEIS|nr:tRNA (adenosine(37)-N6)-dimethylallyltransferase MiaA [Parachitinimonas caeni]MDK2123540.1 tRNA (adenosine(37)-N6)-dimethylallyltransferase MiaA [Parachitinimonas caeni]